MTEAALAWRMDAAAPVRQSRRRGARSMPRRCSSGAVLLERDRLAALAADVHRGEIA
jgi:hypothetical protein